MLSQGPPSSGQCVEEVLAPQTLDKDVAVSQVSLEAPIPRHFCSRSTGQSKGQASGCILHTSAPASRPSHGDGQMDE